MLYYPQAALWVVGFGSLVSEFADGDTRGLFIAALVVGSCYAFIINYG